MATVRDRSMIVNVARMYYEQDMSQDQIARVLLTSRSNVSRILSEAKKKGIVEFKVVEHSKRDTDLEQQLVSLFGLLTAYVAKVPEGTDEYQAVGQIASHVFLNHMKPNAKIALSWGRSLEAMVDEIPENNRPDLTIIPLIGGMMEVPAAINGENLVRVLASRIRADFKILHSPTIVQSSAVKLAFMNEPSIKGVIELAKNADIAFVGIGSKGSTSSQYILEAAGLQEATHRPLFKNVVGDIACRFYGENGEPVDQGLESRTVGLALSEIRKIKKVIGIAVGDDKPPGVLGALRGNLVTTLITTSACAKSVLELAGKL
jgi:DNA-binding transcriptional regulator LsrR (DeoR family)